jgi:hypothetical protein
LPEELGQQPSRPFAGNLVAAAIAVRAEQHVDGDPRETKIEQGRARVDTAACQALKAGAASSASNAACISRRRLRRWASLHRSSNLTVVFSAGGDGGSGLLEKAGYATGAPRVRLRRAVPG